MPLVVDSEIYLMICKKLWTAHLNAPKQHLSPRKFDLSFHDYDS